MTKPAAYHGCTALADAIVISFDVRCFEYVVCKSVSVKAILNNKLILACNAFNRNGNLNLSSCEVSCGLVDLTSECADGNETLGLKSLLNGLTEAIQICTVVEADLDVFIGAIMNYRLDRFIIEGNSSRLQLEAKVCKTGNVINILKLALRNYNASDIAVFCKIDDSDRSFVGRLLGFVDIVDSVNVVICNGEISDINCIVLNVGNSVESDMLTDHALAEAFLLTVEDSYRNISSVSAFNGLCGMVDIVINAHSGCYGSIVNHGNLFLIGMYNLL